MLKIRLRRMGARNNPFFRVVVSDSRNTPTAAAVEEIGHYDPDQAARADDDRHRPRRLLGQPGRPDVAHGQEAGRPDEEEERLNVPELADDLKELVRLLVDQPDQVEVQEIPSRRGGGILELQGRSRRPRQGDRAPGADRPGDAHAAGDPRGPAGCAL